MQPDQIESSLRKDVVACDSLEALEGVRIRYLGRKGVITAMLRGIKDASPADRPARPSAR
jgi:phenylalanyl-tRNA synthetase alpha chain